jgi:hypothetical protein
MRNPSAFQYIDGTGIAADAKGPLFRTVGRDGKLTGNALHRVLRTGAQARCCCRDHGAHQHHSFRATGITVFRKLGGSLENAALMANHASTRTTELYDRRSDPPDHRYGPGSVVSGQHRSSPGSGHGFAVLRDADLEPRMMPWALAPRRPS